MSIPTSLIVVLLVIAWLVVLVPMVAKRRDKVPRAESGGQGFRVLRRAQATLQRRPRRTAKATAESGSGPDTADVADVRAGEGPAAADLTPATARTERTLVPVGAAPGEQPQDAAQEWAAAHPGYRTTAPRPVEAVGDETPTHRFPAAPAPVDQDGLWTETGDHPADHGAGADGHASFAAADGPDGYAADGYAEDEGPEHPAEPSVTAFPYARAPQIPNEIDEQEWDEHAAAASAPAHPYEVQDEALRPTPRRRGRGGYDPEAAEATRAYKYRQRRRVTMVLAGATVLFAVVALLLASWLWAGAVISAALLALYLTYLRRQVKIEAQIRQRRMERLQRARQIRPEYGRGRPPARAGRSAAGPGRTVVDLDDDDPTFDHLDPYDPPVTYRRAAGQ
ncbi:gephyrin-like molybdotransferase receptor GlpR [Nakamurella sp.]|uniref:divisome protein SepX/GlpR n=1 Tax=Nakamurella sp. TaxID=1869182 RepID=UPI003B3AEBE2